MKPLISVIVPVYKVEQYLNKCVDSILNQTYTNLEVILVDDGSPDSCGAICDGYAAKDPRVRVIHKENGGLSDARNAGMAMARGEYLSFADSDDMLPERAFEILHQIAVEKKADLVIGGYRRFTEEPQDETDDSVTIRCFSKVEAMKDFLCNGCASWARLYRREIHAPVLFPVGEINEDEAIVLRLLDVCDRIVLTDQVVYHYRCRPESITTASFSEKKLAWVKHCRDNLAFIREKYPQLEADALARYRNSVLWLMREISLQKAGYGGHWNSLRRELEAHFGLFWAGAGNRDRILMILFRYFPRKLAYTLFSKRSEP